MPAAGVVAACGIGALHARAFWGFEIDDAFISFRYAANLVHGHGFTYNPGERVEGTSSFGFVLLLAPGIALGLDALSCARVLGILAFLGIIAVVAAFVRWLLPEHPWLPAGGALMTAMSTPLAHYSVAGMETNVYALAVLVGLFAYARHLKAEARFTNWSVFLGLASWLRPEGFTLFGLLAVIDLARVWRVAGLRTASRATLGHLAWFGVIFGPLLMFRLAYFGELIPNTVTAKGGYAGELLRKPIEALLSEFPKHPGVTRLVEFYERSVAVLIPLALPALLLPALRAPTTACLAVLMAITAVHFWNAGDWMVHYRLLVPAIGPLAVMIASGLGALRTLVGNQRAGRVLYGISAIFIVAIGSWRQSYERGLGISALPRAPAIDAFGRTLAKIRREDDILATDLAGRVPYDSGLRTLDVFGLCDKKIAQLGTSAGRYGKHYWPRVAEVRPSLFYFQGAQEFKRMYEHPSFAPLRDDYLYVRTPFLKNMPQRVFLVRKDRPDVDLLEQTLRAELWTLERAGVTAR